MSSKRKTFVAASALAALAALGGVAVATGDDAPQDAAEGQDVTPDDGRQVEVQLDEALNVVGDEDDSREELEGREANADEPEGPEDAAEDEAEGADIAITGDPLAKASARALEVVQEEFGQGGRVTDTEVEDEESYYEVEVTLDDGRQVDVQLDESLDFVGID